MAASESTPREYRLIIGGEAVEGVGSYEIVNPATEQVVAHAPEASVEQANAAVDAAADAFTAWSRTTPEERAELLDPEPLYLRRPDAAAPSAPKRVS